MSLRIHLAPDVPCSHPGCLSHVAEPCEVCGRIAGRYPESEIERLNKQAADLQAELTELRALYADRDRDLAFEYKRANDAEEKVSTQIERLAACRDTIFDLQAENARLRATLEQSQKVGLDAFALSAEIERVHQYLDECQIGGDGTEPLLERVCRGMNIAHVRALREAT
jgi:chromosome segregation ATPase